MAFVGIRTATKEQLGELIHNPAIARSPSYYFLRWFGKVSGIQMTLPDEEFPSPEGQLFNTELELRWKQRGEHYEVLLLGRSEPDAELGFSPLQGNWECCDRTACFYDNDETKFPKGFLYQDEVGEMLNPREIPVKQRYFQDTKTSTIHFVVLTIGKPS